MTRFCPQCGAPVPEGARFCNKCGTPLVPTQPQAGTAPAAQYPPPPNYQQTSGFGQYPYQQPYQAAPSTGNLKSNIGALLCYPLSFVTGIIFLVLTPYNRDRFIKFHAYQSIFFFIALFIASIAFRIFLPRPLEVPLLGLLRLLFLAVTGFLMYKAYQGERFKLPIVGDLAEQQAEK